MNGLITNNCCCDSSPCCGVGGDEPFWYNRYCFQLSKFRYLYRECECMDPLNDCNDCPEPANCVGCKECCREREIELCASGAIFRNPLNALDCPTTANDPTGTWFTTPDSVCNVTPYQPPNYSSSEGGVTSFYTTPPCDCTIAQNDRLTWIGRTRNESVSGCCDAGDFDEPVNCVAGQAIIECIEAPCDTVSYPCCTLDPNALRTHYFKISLGVVRAPWPECPCSENVPVLTFTFAAQLGPRIGPHMASWDLIHVTPLGDCLYPNGFLPCQEPECCNPDDPGPTFCCVNGCGEWGCEPCDGPNPTSRCKVCHDLLFEYPTITFSQYQNCIPPIC